MSLGQLSQRHLATGPRVHPPGTWDANDTTAMPSEQGYGGFTAK